MDSTNKQPQKTDRRLLRTKRRIREAFADLAVRKDVDSITIKELAELADIDRKTFYLHYSSIGDVLNEIQTELLEQLNLLIMEYDLFQPSFDALAFFRKINSILNTDYELYRKLVMADRYSFFFYKMKEKMKDLLMEKYYQRIKRSPVSLVKLNLYIEYATAGIMSIYVSWLQHPEYNLEEVAEAATDIAYGGGQAVLEKIKSDAR